MNKTTRITVALLFTAWSIDYLDRLAINIALPLIGRDLDISYTQLGVVASSFFIAYAAMQLPGGFLADRFGGLALAVSGMVAWSIFTGLTALSTSLWMLIVFRVLFGISQGLYPGSAMKLLAERITPEHRMTANGWVNSSNVFGGILASAVAAIALPFVGWRGMFLIISAFGILMAVAFLVWMPRPIVAVEPPQKNTQQARKLFKTPTMWLYVVAFFGYDVMMWGANSWGVAYVQEVKGIPPNESAIGAVVPGLVGVIAIILSGKFADKLNGRPRVLIIPAMLVGILVVFLVPRIDNLIVLLIVFTFGMSIASFAYIACFAQPLKHLHPKVAGLASGMILTGGMVAGAISPIMFGGFVDAFGWTVAWSGLAIGPVITILASLKMPRTQRDFEARFPPELLASTPRLSSDPQAATNSPTHNETTENSRS